MRNDLVTLGDISGFSWDYKYDGTTASYSSTWSTSTLNTLLNDAYYNSGTTNYYNNSATPIELKFESEGLSSKVHNKIERVEWKINGHNVTAIYTSEMYGYEREGTNSWSGKIALMNPSDYGYSVDLSSCQSLLNNYGSKKCVDSSWIYNSTKHQWTLIPVTLYTDVVFNVLSLGRISNAYTYFNTFSVRPVLYLKSDVGVVEEKETSEGLKYLVVG